MKSFPLRTPTSDASDTCLSHTVIKIDFRDRNEEVMDFGYWKGFIPSGTLRIINIHGINWGFIHDISTKMFSIPLRIGQNEQVRKNKKQLLIPDEDKGLFFAR